MKEIFTLTDLASKSVEVKNSYWYFLVFKVGHFPAPKPAPSLEAAKLVEVNRPLARISGCSVGQAPAHQPAPRVGLVGGQSSINCSSLMICCCLVGQVPARQPALSWGQPNRSKWTVHYQEFLVAQLGNLPPTNPPPGSGWWVGNHQSTVYHWWFVAA